jgi:hypothetical protein
MVWQVWREVLGAIVKTQVRKAVDNDGVRTVAMQARRLVTVGTNNPVWAWAKDWHEGVAYTIHDLLGAIVRLQPPADANDQQIAAVKKHLMSSGAAIVRTDSRAQAATLLVKVMGKDGKEVDAPKLAPRQVVMEMAETSSRKEALKALLDLELAKVKL